MITSILVLGATTMVPIIQYSFAHKKSDFKKESNTNTNTNTNSADSTSSSTGIADNTNNINNSACTVSVTTCSKGSTTTPIGISPPPLGGTLNIFKNCDDCLAGDVFPITVTGNNPQPSSFTLQNGDSQFVKLGPGNYTITEITHDGFSPEFAGNCKGAKAGSNEATGTISPGKTVPCGINNTFFEPP